MKFYVSKEQYAAFDEEQKQLIKDNFTFHSSGDKQRHTKEHIDIDTGYNIIVNDLELFPTVTYAPTKEQYSSLTDELKSKVRELMFWDTKQSVWESRPGKAREVFDFVRYELNAHAGFEADDSLTFQLIEGMKNIRTSEDYITWLNSMAQFTTYSPNNQLLIALQNPNVSYIAGKAKWWKVFRRNLNRDAKGLYIYAPKIREFAAPTPEQERKLAAGEKVPENEIKKVKVLTGFYLTKVYDISETHGQELPQAPIHTLSEDVEDFDVLKAALIATAAPYTVSFVSKEDLGHREAKGVCNIITKEIKIRDDLPPAQTIKTMIHELAHSRLHDIAFSADADTKPRNIKELEAESTAYIICRRYGIDASDYTFGYIAGWTEGCAASEVEKVLTDVAQFSHDFANEIDAQLEPVQEIQQVCDDSVLPNLEQ